LGSPSWSIEPEVEVGVRDHAAELGHIDDARAEDVPVERDRAAGVGDRQEGVRTSRVRPSVRGVAAGGAEGACGEVSSLMGRG
jgi:hypothetical protein